MFEKPCRFCGTLIQNAFLDLGQSPIANALVPKTALPESVLLYPLALMVCENCWLVQLTEIISPDVIFNEQYTYFSSFSDSWLDHAKRYSQALIDKLSLTSEHRVIEIASNDGYLLQYFHQAGIPVLGIEPSDNVADAARKKGIETVTAFLTETNAQQMVMNHGTADLLIANNVIAHVPDLKDFVKGLTLLLKETGVLTLEFPHWLALSEGCQFDTIYHEHYSYFSFTSMHRILNHHGLNVFDIEYLNTHGGSLRIYAAKKLALELQPDLKRKGDQNVRDALAHETAKGIQVLETYQQFSTQVNQTRHSIQQFFIQCKQNGKKVVGYGAPAKAVTLSSFCGITHQDILWTVDRSPHKQGFHLPGTEIAIESPEKIFLEKPDYVFIFPWNLKDEIISQMTEVFSWGGQFVIPLPEVTLIGKPLA